MNPKLGLQKLIYFKLFYFEIDELNTLNGLEIKYENNLLTLNYFFKERCWNRDKTNIYIFFNFIVYYYY